MHNVKAAFRSLLKSPGFTAVAVLTLALGIGANTAIFSAVHALLIRPLPYAEPEQLVSVQTKVRREQQWERRSTSLPDFRDYRAEATRSFTGLAAVSGATFNLTGSGDPQRIRGEFVSSDYFELFRASPVLGRVFTAEEDSAPDKSPLVVLAHAFWRGQFAGDPAVLGRQLLLNDQTYTVVGVAPPGFTGLDSDTQLWVPMAMAGRGNWEGRGSRWHEMVGRLRPGVTLEQARAELDAVGSRLAAAHPASNSNYGATLTPLRDDFFGPLRQPLLVLMGAVAVVLLITCANVANLLLVRLAARRREIAVRASLGASRGQLGALFLAEAAWLAAAGGVLALVFAHWFIAALSSINPINLPAFAQVELSWPVFAFSAAATLVCTLGVGTLPALLAAATDLNASLKDEGRGSAGSATAGRLRAGLVFAELAFSLTLLVAAALFLRSFVNLMRQDTGYRTERVLAQRIALPPQRYNAAQTLEFAQRLRERAAALPGVAVAAISSDTPLDGFNSANFATVEGAAAVPAENELRVYRHQVSPEMFAAMGLVLKQGENFAAGAAPDAEPVAIVSESFARKFWSDGSAVGRRFKIGRSNSNAPWMRIVGVVADAKWRGLVRNPTNDPDMFVPFSFNPPRTFSLVVHTRSVSASALADLRQLVRSLDASLPAFDVATIERRVADGSANERFSAYLMGGFALTALLLATLGLYGVVAFGVAQRTREIGVRMALGARPADILRLIVGGTGRLVVAGLAAGCALSFALAPLLEALLFGVSARDPLTYAAVAGLLALVALGAAWAPARRATRVDPAIALHAE